MKSFIYTLALISTLNITSPTIIVEKNTNTYKTSDPIIKIEKNIDKTKETKSEAMKLDWEVKTIKNESENDEIKNNKVENNDFKNDDFNEEIIYSDDDMNNIYILAQVIEGEAGSDFITNEHQKSVASVVMNRVMSEDWPNTIKDVFYQKRQYGCNKNLTPSERALSNAKYIYSLYVYDNSYYLPRDVVFQNNSPQDSGIHKEFYYEELNNTTYFCYK